MKRVLKTVGILLLVFALAVSENQFYGQFLAAEVEEHPKEDPTEEVEPKKEQTIQTEEKMTLCYGQEVPLTVSTTGDGEISAEIVETEETPVVKLLKTEGGYGIEAVGVGTAVIRIVAAETEAFLQAEAEVLVTVTKAQQKIVIDDLEKEYGDAPFDLKPELAEGDGEISLSMEDTNVAEMTDDGRIQILCVGEVKITVTAAETDYYEETAKTITLSVKSSLEKPEITSVVNQNGSIKVTWKQIPEAHGYYLYRKVSSGSWKKIAVYRDSRITDYTDTEIEAGKKYYYRMKAYADEGKNITGYCSSKSVRYLTMPSVRVTAAASGNLVLWTQTPKADGYYIYRREISEKSWTRVKKITSGTVVSWKDTSVSNGRQYFYTVKAYEGSSKSVAYKPGAFILRMSAPSVRKVSRLSPRKLKAQWGFNSAASGYQLQYSTNSLFCGKKTLTFNTNRTLEKTIGKLSKNKTYYIRVRAYRNYNGSKYYSAWSHYKNIKNTKQASIVSLKKGKGIFELRKQAKQSLYQYDTLQGGCSDGRYGYFMLYNRSVEKCKIAKVKLSNMKVVKVSSALNVAHGNDMTYNSDLKRLQIVHNTRNPRRISTVNPQSLKVEDYQDIKIPSKIGGASEKETRAITGFGGIAYNAKRNCYVMLLSKSANLLILDKNMQPVSYLKPTKKNAYTYQGIDATDDYILVGQSPKPGSGQSYNIISVYTWEGVYVSKINVKKGYELEHIYHAGNQFYAGFYRSYYKVYYTKKKKKVLVHGKKKKITVKVRHRKFVRDNYIYKIKNL